MAFGCTTALASPGGVPARQKAITGPAPNTSTTNRGGRTALDRPGMWIWYVDASHGGKVSRIIHRAKRSGIGTLYIKAGDSNNDWSQFTPSLIRRLHNGGLKVCAWQYIYGTLPTAEAKVGARAVAKGADCLAIDAEAEYEGKYASADRYMRVLRNRIGASFPVALAAFPYADYHPGFPYSVFLGPGAAQYNQPQMYWKTIGVSVREVFEHTYLYNMLYGRTIYPVGQTYLNPSIRDLKKFRRFSINYGAAPSWWSWQETPDKGWKALAAKRLTRIPDYQRITGYPSLRKKSRGDFVVWAQQHLVRAVDPGLPVTGVFAGKTRRAVILFQRSRGLEADGVIGNATWRRLLKVKPVRIRWSSPSRDRVARASGDGASPRSGNAPASADMPAKAYEIGPGPK